MVARTGLLVFALLVGCLAVRVPEKLKPDHHILGGTPVPPGYRPYMVALTIGPVLRNFLCGASLISKKTVLTAAHCVEPLYKKGSLSRSLRVIVGTNQWNTGGVKYPVQRNITHEHYLVEPVLNDISLLITVSDVTFSDIVSPIALTYDEIAGGVSAVVSGWGRIGVDGPIAANLQELQVTTITGQECIDKMAEMDHKMDAFPLEPAIHICTSQAPGFGTCVHDSGSPLARTSDDHQIGIVSWGLPCAVGAPDVFVRISGFSAWLEENIV